MSLLILRLDQLVTLAVPYYYCFYLFIFLSHVSHPLPGGAGEGGEPPEDMAAFLGRGFCSKNRLPSHAIKRGLGTKNVFGL